MYSEYAQNTVYSGKHNNEILLPLIETPETPLKKFKEKLSGGTMELHPLLSQLEETDLERYMNACKEDVMNFLDDFGLSNTLALQVLGDVRPQYPEKQCSSIAGFPHIKFFLGISQLNRHSL